MPSIPPFFSLNNKMLGENVGMTEETLRQDAGSRLLIGVTVTVALLLYIIALPDPFMTPILLLFAAGVLRIYVSTKKVKVDIEISQKEKYNIVSYALIGLLGMLVGGLFVEGLYDPPIPPVITSLTYFPMAALIFSQLMAISEEVYFRGELFQLFSIKFGPSLSTGITAIFFGVYHLPRYGTSTSDLGYVIIGGLILSWTASKTLRVLTPMISHCLNNLLGTAFVLPVLILLCVWTFIKYRRGKIFWQM